MQPKALNAMVGFVTVLGLFAPMALAQPSSPTEVTSGDITLSVRFDNLADPPEEGTHFEVTFDASDVPTVNLLIGRTGGGTLMQWRVWCKDSSDDPADIAEIGAVTNFDFDVKVLDASDGDGADDLTNLILDPFDADKFSNLADGRLAGRLDGALFLQESSSGSGGELTLEIDGSVSGDITVPKLMLLDVGGNVSSDWDIAKVPSTGLIDIAGNVTSTATISVDEFEEVEQTDGDFLIGGNVAGAIEIGINRSSMFRISGDLSGTVDVTQTLDSGRMFFDGDVASTGIIQVADMEGDNPRLLFAGDKTFNGKVVLTSGIPAGRLCFFGGFGSSAVVDLTSDDVAGDLDLFAGGSGSITNGGAVTGTVVLGDGNISATAVFSGSASFASVDASSVGIWLNTGADLSGTIDVSGNVAGEINVDGDVLSSGHIDIGGGLVGELVVGGAMSGQVDIGSTVAGTSETYAISIGGAMSGDIAIGSHLTEDVQVSGEMTNTATLTVSGSLNGDVSFGLSVDGTIDAQTELGSSGSITIAEQLKARGRVLVDELAWGPISVGEDTVALSLIHVVEGIASTGSITINNSAGAFDADGDIRVGTTNVTPPLDSVTFDGSILIKKQNGGTGGGDLTGTIRVVGCHATGDDLDIGICGGDGCGNIEIVQTNCTNQVEADCVTECQ